MVFLPACTPGPRLDQALVLYQVLDRCTSSKEHAFSSFLFGLLKVVACVRAIAIDVIATMCMHWHIVASRLHQSEVYLDIGKSPELSSRSFVHAWGWRVTCARSCVRLQEVSGMTSNTPRLVWSGPRSTRQVPQL